MLIVVITVAVTVVAVPADLSARSAAIWHHRFPNWLISVIAQARPASDAALHQLPAASAARLDDFVRENNTIKDISKLHFEEGHKLLSIYNDSEGENEVFRSNSLFLSAVAAMNGKLSKQISNTISSITVLSGLQDKQLYNISGTNLRNEETKNKVIHQAVLNSIKGCVQEVLK